MTTYITDSKAVSELYLLRSYNHLKRSTTSSRRWTSSGNESTATRGVERRINYGLASQLEIWQAARAATAAPMFFEQMPLTTDSGGYRLEDGGLGVHNNPTLDAILDITEQTGRDSVYRVVSVGSARKPVTSKAYGISFGLFSVGWSSVEKSLESDVVTDYIGRIAESGTNDMKYYRFDDEFAMDFDEWEPKRGSQHGKKTLSRIRHAFEAWYIRSVNHDRLQQCARQLVAARRARVAADTGRWERFATGCKYHCPRENCVGKWFSKRGAFENHLIVTHGWLPNIAELEANISREEFSYKTSGTTLISGPATHRRQDPTDSRPSSQEPISRVVITSGNTRDPATTGKPLKSDEKSAIALDSQSREGIEAHTQEPDRAQTEVKPIALQTQYKKVIEKIDKVLDNPESHELCPEVALALDKTLLRMEIWVDEVNVQDEPEERVLQSIEARHQPLTAKIIESLKVLLESIQSLLDWQVNYTNAVQK